MSTRHRIIKRLLKTFLPIVLVILVATGCVMAWLVNGTTRPPRRAYLVTPQTFSQVTGPILNAKDETWINHDGTKSRGWLIRGEEGAPGVILLHRYGTDRSWLLNLAVKLHETTNFTILWPDLRGHGDNPLVNWTLFGAIEGDDAAAAIDYLRSLKTPSGKPQISESIGMYGVEMGAYAAINAAARYPNVRALALDSIPASPDDVVRAATNTRTSTNNRLFHLLGLWGIRIYSLGKYRDTPSCEFARTLSNRRVLLLTGEPTDPLRASTGALVNCFPRNSAVEVRAGLPLTGFNLPASTGEQEEAYDRPVINFFDKALR
jgi:pimeloyl-ACP methyl ester carboxylesterase